MFKMLAKTVYRARCVYNVSNAVHWRLIEKKVQKIENSSMENIN